MYRSRYGNMSYTIKLFSILKNKWLNGICLSAKCFPLCIQGCLFPQVCRSFCSSSLAVVLALSYIASSTYDDNTCPKFVALAWSWWPAKNGGICSALRNAPFHPFYPQCAPLSAPPRSRVMLRSASRSCQKVVCQKNPKAISAAGKKK